jgi:hypothetical protein
MQDAGGAAMTNALVDEQRGSTSFEEGGQDGVALAEHEQRIKEKNIERLRDYNKKTKIPLQDRAGGNRI